MANRNYFDISVGISPEMGVWPGDPPVEISKIASHGKGDACEISRLIFSSHTGTHIDPPVHFIQNGRTADQIDLTKCIGPALVAALPGRPMIHKKGIEAYDWNHIERILFKTKNSKFNRPGRFREDFTFLSEDAADFLLTKNIKLVGIDYLSVEGESDLNFPVHRKLLKAEVILLEGLNLSAVPPGMYNLVCLPLKITNGDGAPARAVLFPVNDF
ncbi:kynurenine formamidase [bacterium BMS3Abin05]|nr:kynurenine formamidase [bacterium BMS3Abin05]GBE27613.1 kynurenine formamidase [bacterium BMS3Bbin03]